MYFIPALVFVSLFISSISGLAVPGCGHQCEVCLPDGYCTRCTDGWTSTYGICSDLIPKSEMCEVLRDDDDCETCIRGYTAIRRTPYCVEQWITGCAASDEIGGPCAVCIEGQIKQLDGLKCFVSVVQECINWDDGECQRCATGFTRMHGYPTLDCVAQWLPGCIASAEVGGACVQCEWGHVLEEDGSSCVDQYVREVGTLKDPRAREYEEMLSLGRDDVRREGDHRDEPQEALE